MDQQNQLRAAAITGDAQRVQELLDAGADPDRVDGWPSFPLREAVVYASWDVVLVLLQAGADVDHAGDEPGDLLRATIDALRHRPSPAALAVLTHVLRRGPMTLPGGFDPVIHAVDRQAPARVVRLLLKFGADPDAWRRDGTPAVVLAATRGSTSGLDALLEAGADPDSVDSEGRTALMHAVERGLEDVVASLLLAGADTTRRAADGSSAPDLARAWQRDTSASCSARGGWARIASTSPGRSCRYIPVGPD